MYLGEHNNLVNEFFAFRNQTLIICVTALFTNGEAFTLWSFLLNSTVFVKEKIDSINNLSVTELKYCLMYWSNIPKKKMEVLTSSTGRFKFGVYFPLLCSRVDTGMWSAFPKKGAYSVSW